MTIPSSASLEKYRPMMGRREKYRKRNGVYDPRVFTRMPLELVEALEAAAVERKITRSIIIREALFAYLQIDRQAA
jgi:hypothetical protein